MTPLNSRNYKDLTSPEKSKTSSDDFDETDLLCHDWVLCALSENIFLIFCTTKSTTELWEALDVSMGLRNRLERYIDWK